MIRHQGENEWTARIIRGWCSENINKGEVKEYVYLAPQPYFLKSFVKKLGIFFLNRPYCSYDNPEMILRVFWYANNRK